jgi:hypothetical protein
MNDLLDDHLLDDPGDRPRFGDRLGSAARQLFPSSPTPDSNQPPSRMQPPEDRVGFGVAAILVICGVLFLSIHGKGSPKHPNEVLPAIGIAVAVALPVVIIRFRNRFVSALLAAAIVLLLTSTRPPNSLSGLYFVVFVAGLGYLLWLTLRQSKAARAQAKNQPRLTPEERRARRERQRRGEKEPERTGPTANRRYTPPQPAKAKRKRGELPERTSGRSRPREGASTGRGAGKSPTAASVESDADDGSAERPARRLLRRRP